MNKKNGFTLMELVITLVAAGILAMIAVPAYKGYVNKGLDTEGKALLNEIDSAQQIYYSRHGHYYAGTANQQHGASFGVDTRRNKYFTSYSIVSDESGHYTAKANYKTKIITMKGSITAEPQIIG